MYLKNNKGLTLVELLITIAILGILMAAISAFIFPTMSFFAKSQNTANAKNAANLIMDYIEGSVYSTDEITLQQLSSPGITPEKYYLLTANEINGILLYTNATGLSLPVFRNGITEGLRFTITFSKAQDQVLHIDIVVKSRQNSEELYGLEKDIYLANLLTAPNDKIHEESASGPYPEIKFTKPTGTTP